MVVDPRSRRRSPGAASLLPLAGLAALALAACGDDDGPPTEPPPGPTTGTVEVSAATTGDTLDRDGYTVTLDGGGERALDPDGTVTFEEVEEGDHEVELSGVQANCEADGGATRTVSVVAEETSTASFDVACAPALFDRIVFASSRDGNMELYAMEPDGSSPTRLTTASSEETHPSVSPDGTRIVLMSDSGGDVELFVMTVDEASILQLTDDPTFDRFPSWSPDGERIAFMSFRSGDSEVWVVNVDGTGLTNLTSEPGSGDGFPAWTPLRAEP